jgi:hypothetical protein
MNYDVQFYELPSRRVPYVLRELEQLDDGKTYLTSGVSVSLLITRRKKTAVVGILFGPDADLASIVETLYANDATEIRDRTPYVN